MKLPFTSVVSYHTNPTTCGVAKFGKQLADRLGVPFVGLDGEWGVHPLLSLKASERPPVFEHLPTYLLLSVFWHDGGYPDLTNHAAHVFYADPSLGSPGLFCPSLITPRQMPVRLFAFGMAHKLQTEKFLKAYALLAASGLTFHLRVSVGLHEGTSLDGAERQFNVLRGILGPENVTILGCLSDDAVAEELAKADYVLAFFEKGLRANNTTVHAALNAGKRVIANCDEHTVEPLRSMVLDINQISKWPQGPGGDYYSWDALIAAMEQVCASSRSTVAR